MIVIFDLDYTLLDVSKLKKHFAKAMKISNGVYEQSYARNFTQKKTNYHPLDHVDMLVKKGKISAQNIETVKKNLQAVLGRIDEFQFPAAARLLKELHQAGHELILLSYGNIAYQEQKIAEWTARKYFQKIIVTDQSKIKSLSFLREQRGTKVLINDNARESLAIKKAFPDIKLVLIKGPYTDNVRHQEKTYALRDCTKALAIKVVKKIIRGAGLKFELVNDGQCIGRAYLYLLHNSLHKRPFGFIEDVEIDSEFRGQGLGSKLVEQLIIEAKKRQCYKLMLTSRYGKPQVHKLYEKHGFQDWGKEFRMNL